MTVYFENNSYKYETEAVLKLFRPLESFEFVFDNTPPSPAGDYLRVCVSDDLSVFVSLGGRYEEKHSPLTDEKERELVLCKMLFTVLSEITGIRPAWGCLTGIRPVKKVHALIDEGCGRDEVIKHLESTYFVSESRGGLAYDTAVTQRAAVNSLQKNSFSLYISVPFCPTRCSYCSFVSHSVQSKGARELIPKYVDMLCREIGELGEMLSDKNVFCDTVYIGGGTPTSLSAREIDRIMKKIAGNIDISRIREYTVEAGRADTITAEKLSVIKDNGATRISVNPQTMQDSVLEAIGRRHTAAEAEEKFLLARKAGFDNINTDLIAGLPTDSLRGFEDTLERIIGLSPENITVHTLTVKRSSALFGKADEMREQFGNDSITAKMTDLSVKRLTAAGYSPYYLYRQKNTVGGLENVGWTKPGREGLYNIYIMDEAQNILACGAGGSTKLIDPSTGKIVRYFNYKYPYEYISRYEKMTEYKAKAEEFLRQKFS